MKKLIFTLLTLVLAGAVVSCGDDDKGKNLPVGKTDDFVINVTELTTATIKATITPKDKDMFYIAQVDYIYDHDFDFTVNEVYPDTENILWNIVLENYIVYAKRNNIDIFEFLTQCNVGGRGTIELERTMLHPGGKYGIVVIGVEYDENEYLRLRTVTPTNFEVVELDTALNKDISFETNVTLDPIIGSDVSVDVTPKGWDGIYHYTFYERYPGYDTYEFYKIDEDTPDEQFIHYSDVWYDTLNHYIVRDLTEEFEAILRDNTLTGEVKGHRCQLKANKEYCMVIYALDSIDGLMQLVSYPHITYFTTSAYEHSDITFDVNFDEIASRRVIYDITPSTNTEGYCAMIKRVDECEGWNDELLQKSIADQCIYCEQVLQGAQSFENCQLRPDTDYYLICFGLHGENITTPMVKIPFRTEPEREADCKVEGIEVVGPFDNLALYNYDPVKYAATLDGAMGMVGYYSVGINITISQSPRKIHFGFFSEDNIRGMSNEDIIDLLRQAGEGREIMYLYVKGDIKGRFYALVMDEDGDVDLYITPEEYLFTRDNLLTTTEDVARLAEIYDKARALHNQNKSAVIAPDTPEAEAKEMCVKAKWQHIVEQYPI